MEYLKKRKKELNERDIEIELIRKKRKRLSKTRVFKKNYKGVFTLFFLFLLFYFLFYSTFFNIKEVEIRGLGYIDEEVIQNQVNYLKGENFFSSDLVELREKLVEENVFVGSVYTEKVFPNSVLVNIVEKEPFLIVKTLGDCFLIDKEGFTLSDDTDCSELFSNFKIIYIYGEDIDELEFDFGEKSQLYDIYSIFEILKVLEYYDYRVSNLFLEEQVLEVELHDESLIIFSLFEDLDFQLKRLIILTKYFETERGSFNSLDVRYKRPVILGK